jgi:hypothetical protein
MIALHLDKCTAWSGLYLEHDTGKRADLEQAFEAGFFVRKADSNAVLSLIQKHLAVCDEFSGCPPRTEAP